MSCPEWQEGVALSLDEPAGEDVERHLADCPECREFRAGLLSDRDALRGLPEAPQWALLEVRRRTLAAVRRRRRLPYWAAAIAAGLAVLAVAVPRSRPVVSKPVAPVAAAQKERTPTVAAQSPAPRPKRVPSRPRQQAAQRIPPVETEPLVVKLVTDDPDVVIYWLAESKGDGQ